MNGVQLKFKLSAVKQLLETPLHTFGYESDMPIASIFGLRLTEGAFFDYKLFPEQAKVTWDILERVEGEPVRRRPFLSRIIRLILDRYEPLLKSLRDIFHLGWTIGEFEKLLGQLLHPRPLFW